MTTLLTALVVVAIPFLAVTALLMWAERREDRRQLARDRQIALTDAIHWELGAFIDMNAFDGHTWGRPKIDRMRLLFSTPQSATARLLAGEVQLSAGVGLDLPTLRGFGFSGSVARIRSTVCSPGHGGHPR